MATKNIPPRVAWFIYPYNGGIRWESSAGFRKFMAPNTYCMTMFRKILGLQTLEIPKYLFCHFFCIFFCIFFAFGFVILDLPCHFFCIFFAFFWHLLGFFCIFLHFFCIFFGICLSFMLYVSFFWIFMSVCIFCFRNVSACLLGVRWFCLVAIYCHVSTRSLGFLGSGWVCVAARVVTVVWCSALRG